MRKQIKYSILCFLLLTTWNTVVAQFNAYSGACGGFVSCVETTTVADFCRCGLENKDFQWTLNNYDDIAPDVNAIIAQQRALIRQFNRDFQNAAKEEIEDRFDQSFPDFRSAQLFFFDQWASSAGSLYGVNPRIAYDTFHEETAGFKSNFQLVTTDLSVLEFRRNELLNGTIEQSEVGSYMVEGITMNTIKTIEELDGINKLYKP